MINKSYIINNTNDSILENFNKIDSKYIFNKLITNEKADNKIHPIRRLKDKSTEAFTKIFFNESKHRSLFSEYVYNRIYFDIMSNVPNYNNLQINEYIYFIFKGGNLMEQMHNIHEANTSEIFKANIKEYFKISDYDFNIYIKCIDPIRFDIIKKKISISIIHSLELICTFFNEYLKNILSNTDLVIDDDFIILNPIKNTDELLQKIKIKIINTNINTNTDTKEILFNIYQQKDVILDKSILLVNCNKYEKILLQENSDPLLNIASTYDTNIKYILFKTKHILQLLLSTIIILIINYYDNLLTYELVRIKQYINFYILCDNSANNIINTNIIINDIIILLDISIENNLIKLQSSIINEKFYSVDKIRKFYINIHNENTIMKNNNSIFVDENLIKYTYSNNLKKFININENNINLNEFDFQIKSTDNMISYLNKNSIIVRNNLKKINNNYHYITVNKTINVGRNYNYNSPILCSFDLIRSKLYIELKNILINKSTNTICEITPISSEFIDISICNFLDNGQNHFNNNYNNMFESIIFIQPKSHNIEILGYSMNHIIDDLLISLFSQTCMMPWIDYKYIKRMHRSFYFISICIPESSYNFKKIFDLCYLIKHNSNDSTRIIKYINTFLDINNINPSNDLSNYVNVDYNSLFKIKKMKYLDKMLYCIIFNYYLSININKLSIFNKYRNDFLYIINTQIELDKHFIEYYNFINFFYEYMDKYSDLCYNININTVNTNEYQSNIINTFTNTLLTINLNYII